MRWGVTECSALRQRWHGDGVGAVREPPTMGAIAGHGGRFTNRPSGHDWSLHQRMQKNPSHPMRCVWLTVHIPSHYNAPVDRYD